MGLTMGKDGRLNNGKMVIVGGYLVNSGQPTPLGCPPLRINHNRDLDQTAGGTRPPVSTILDVIYRGERTLV